MWPAPATALSSVLSSTGAAASSMSSCWLCCRCSRSCECLFPPQESVVEYMQRRSFLNFITSGFFGRTGNEKWRSVNGARERLSDFIAHVLDVRTPLFDPMFDGDYHSYPHSFTGNGLRPHPRIRELAEEVSTLFFHYMENETKSKSPPTFEIGGRKTRTGTDRRREKV